MITQDSSFYKKEKETIESSYRNNVKYNLLDYNIEQIKAIDNKTYKAYVVENIEVKDYKGKIKVGDKRIARIDA